MFFPRAATEGRALRCLHRLSPDRWILPCTLCSNPPALTGGTASLSSTFAPRCPYTPPEPTTSRRCAWVPAEDTCRPRTARQTRCLQWAGYKKTIHLHSISWQTAKMGFHPTLFPLTMNLTLLLILMQDGQQMLLVAYISVWKYYLTVCSCTAGHIRLTVRAHLCTPFLWYNINRSFGIWGLSLDFDTDHILVRFSALLLQDRISHATA